MSNSRWLGAGSKVTIGGLLSLLVASILGTLPAAAQSNIGVYVGYADSFRAASTNFPTPWLGSPNTVFDGCKPVADCVYDAGGVRIVNNSPSSVTVDSVAVHIGTCSYTGWDPATLAPGADLIITQLISGEGQGCTGPSPDFFDTSDIGPNGSNIVFDCPPSSKDVPDGLIPVVDVTIDGVTTSYEDSGQVLNTGGLDAGTCGDGNESIQWTKIGSQPCKGSLLTLAPATQTHPINSTATVVATFTNSCGQPLSDTAVDFSILSGPNAGMAIPTGVTDANGQAPFTYSSANVGTDTLQASVTNLAGTIDSNTVTVIWTVNFAPGGGSFVIGNLEAIDGRNVYWWGAQWWKQDPMTSGLAPAAFKGYETSNSSPWCGQTWTTRPGNSPHPPQTVPSQMALIVSSHITQKGPVISGDIAGIVLVNTRPGYGPNPGHIGRGTVVSILCSTSDMNAQATGRQQTTVKHPVVPAPSPPQAPAAPLNVHPVPAAKNSLPSPDLPRARQDPAGR